MADQTRVSLRGVPSVNFSAPDANASVANVGVNLDAVSKVFVPSTSPDEYKVSTLGLLSKSYAEAQRLQQEKEALRAEKESREGAAMALDPTKELKDAKTKTQYDAFLKLRGTVFAKKKANELIQQAHDGTITSAEAIQQLSTGVDKTDLQDTPFVDGAVPVLLGAVSAVQEAEAYNTRKRAAEIRQDTLVEMADTAVKSLSAGADVTGVYRDSWQTMVKAGYSKTEIKAAMQNVIEQQLQTAKTTEDIDKIHRAWTAKLDGIGSMADNMAGGHLLEQTILVMSERKREELEDKRYRDIQREERSVYSQMFLDYRNLDETERDAFVADLSNEAVITQQYNIVDPEVASSMIEKLQTLHLSTSTRERQLLGLKQKDEAFRIANLMDSNPSMVTLNTLEADRKAGTISDEAYMSLSGELSKRNNESLNTAFLRPALVTLDTRAGSYGTPISSNFVPTQKISNAFARHLSTIPDVGTRAGLVERLNNRILTRITNDDSYRSWSLGQPVPMSWADIANEETSKILQEQSVDLESIQEPKVEQRGIKKISGGRDSRNKALPDVVTSDLTEEGYLTQNRVWINQEASKINGLSGVRYEVQKTAILNSVPLAFKDKVAQVINANRQGYFLSAVNAPGEVVLPGVGTRYYMPTVTPRSFPGNLLTTEPRKLSTEEMILAPIRTDKGDTITDPARRAALILTNSISEDGNRASLSEPLHYVMANFSSVSPEKWRKLSSFKGNKDDLIRSEFKDYIPRQFTFAPQNPYKDIAIWGELMKKFADMVKDNSIIYNDTEKKYKRNPSHPMWDQGATLSEYYATSKQIQ